MSFDDADFFELAGDPDVVQRDNQDRPLIKQPDGSRIAYNRASQLGDFLTDQSFLLEWKLCYLAIAMGRRPDLAEQCAIETYSTGFNEPPARTKAESKRNLLSLINRALDALAINERADRGTVVHAVTEDQYDGFIPMSVIGEHAAFQQFIAINKIQRLGSEIFCVNDELRVAGTFDHLWYIPSIGKVRIGDTKNGRNKNPLGWGIQFANYANSRVYDPATGKRWTLEEYIEDRFGLTYPIDREVANLLSVKDNEAKVSDVNITWGYEMARAAALVRDARGSEAGKVLVSKDLKSVKGKAALELAQAAILERINETTEVGLLTSLWRQHSKIWTPELTTAASARKIALS